MAGFPACSPALPHALRPHVRPCPRQARPSRPRGVDRQPVAGERHLPKVARSAPRGTSVRVLRGAAHRQRDATPGPLPDPHDQRPLPPVPDDAGAVLRAEGGLGHAWSARRGRSLQGTRDPLQGGNRGLWRGALHPQVSGERLAVHEGVGDAHRADRLLDRPLGGLRHLPPVVRGERLVGAGQSLRPRAALPGAQDRLVVGAGGHGSFQWRGWAGLQGGRRPERVRGVSSAR